MPKLISLAFKKLPQAELAEFATIVYNNMTADAQFVSLKPIVDNLKVCIDETAAAVALAENGGPQQTKDKNRKLEELKTKLENLADDVEDLPNSNEDTILASGFKLRKKGGSSPEISEPTNVVVERATRIGSIKLKWNEVPGAVTYGIERLVVGTNEWRNGDYSTGKSVVISGLTPGANVTFRVRAVFRKKQVSDWSQEVTICV